ncbi:replication-relaxation family protein [Candidatus Saccharibacteria bacterium]|nr:replication-relaxation family protein [Candidatus Saccharibacteria bacterium]
MTVAKYRRPLNQEQLAVLQWLYTYRFSTSKQLAKHLCRLNHKAIQNKLQILEEQGYIGKHYDKSYKLQGKPAEYFLIPKGARQLPADSVNERALKALYKNKTVSPEFIAHCLNVTDTALQLQVIYGDKLRLFTRSDMAAYDYFPTWKPDLFLSLKPRTKQEAPRRYFLDVWDDTTPFFVSVRKARNYITYAEEGEWPSEHPMPTVLVICQDDTVEKKLRRQIRRALEEEDSTDEITFATTTRQELDEATTPAKLWQEVAEDNEPIRIGL